MKLIDIETELGNKIIEDLIGEGWNKTNQYSPFAFDKGIDFDSYILKKDSARLEFEWTNWLEWEITGRRSELQIIAKKYGFSAKQENDT